MTIFKSTLKVFGFFVFVFAMASVAEAQATRTWVSGVGDDVNPCSRTAPCKTFAGAISKTATDGEINCLDPGGYGAVTITKSITIDCEDTQGSILASLVNGVIVNATATSRIRLRGLSINGAGNGVNCVRILQAKSVYLEEIACAGFATHGVSIENSSTAIQVGIWNSSFRNITGNGLNTFVTGTGSVAVAIDSSLFMLTGIGINIGAAATVSVNDSTVSHNATGLRADGATSVMSAKDNQVTNNTTTGILAANGATIRIGGNLVTANQVGLSGANIFTWGGNFVDGNPGGNGSNNGAALVQ